MRKKHFMLLECYTKWKKISESFNNPLSQDDKLTVKKFENMFLDLIREESDFKSAVKKESVKLNTLKVGDSFMYGKTLFTILEKSDTLDDHIPHTYLCLYDKNRVEGFSWHTDVVPVA